MLSSIRLINWRSHANTLLEFKKGTNLVIGIMGSGKSSIMDAISFALFGTFPALESRKLSLMDIVRNGEKHAKIELTFIWEGITYRIERTIEKKSTDAFAYANTSLKEKGTKAVTLYVENLLKIDYDLFTRAIYSEQNSIDYFFTLNPKRRKEEFDRLLGLDKFESARANTVSAINKIKSNRKTLELKFDPLKLNYLELKKKESEKKIKEITEELVKIQSALSSKSKELKDKESLLPSLEKKKKEFLTKKDSLLRIQGTISSLESSLNKQKLDQKESSTLKSTLTSDLEKEKSLTLSLRKLEEEILLLSKKSTLLEERKKRSIQLKQELVSLSKKLSENNLGELKSRDSTNLDLSKTSKSPISYQLFLTQKEDSLSKEILDLKAKEKSLQVEIQELIDLCSILKKDHPHCPLCSSELSNEKLDHLRTTKLNFLTQRKSELETTKSSSLSKEKELKSFQTQLTSIRTQLEEKVSLEKQLSSISFTEEELTQFTSQLKLKKEEKELSSKEFSSLLEEIHKIKLELRDLESFLEKKKELELYLSKYTQLKKEMDSISFNEEELEKLKLDYNSLKLFIEKNSLTIQHLKRELFDADNFLKLAEEELSLLKSTKDSISKLIKFEEDLLIYKNALSEVQTSLRAELIFSINQAMNEVWSIFYPYGDYKALKLNVTDSDYSFEIFHQENWKALESIASGGERACAALTLRVALATVLTPNLSWLILDEPTHNLDQESVNLLSETLQTKVPEIVDQTFVITHEELLLGSDFSVSYRLKRDKDNFGATEFEVL